MSGLSSSERRTLARSVRSETWELATAKLQTPGGVLVAAGFAGLLAWAGLRLTKSATPEAVEGEAVIQTAIAVASLVLLPIGLWLWLSISSWKRKAFALQASLTARVAEDTSTHPDDIARRVELLEAKQIIVSGVGSVGYTYYSALLHAYGVLVEGANEGQILHTIAPEEGHSTITDAVSSVLRKVIQEW